MFWTRKGSLIRMTSAPETGVHYFWRTILETNFQQLLTTTVKFPSKLSPKNLQLHNYNLLRLNWNLELWSLQLLRSVQPYLSLFLLTYILQIIHKATYKSRKMNSEQFTTEFTLQVGKKT